MITTVTNLDYLIDPVRMRVGDIDETLFSDNLIRTALVYGVKTLQRYWHTRYLIYTSDMRVSGLLVNTPNGQATLSTLPSEHDVFRNAYVTFDSSVPPTLDQRDEPAIIIAGAIQLRRVAMASSISAFGSWSTPDLSFSNIQGAKTVQSLLTADEDELTQFFKRKLAAPVKQTFPLASTQDLLVYANDVPYQIVVRAY